MSGAYCGVSPREENSGAVGPSRKEPSVPSSTVLWHREPIHLVLTSFVNAGCRAVDNPSDREAPYYLGGRGALISATTTRRVASPGHRVLLILLGRGPCGIVSKTIIIIK